MNEEDTHGPADHWENVSEKFLCIGTTESRVFIIVCQWVEAEARQYDFHKEIGRIVSFIFHLICDCLARAINFLRVHLCVYSIYIFIGCVCACIA